MTVCLLPDHDDYPDRVEPFEGYDEWRDPSGHCQHDYCIEGNRIGRLYASSRKVAGMTPDEIEAIRADRELVLDEYHGHWTQDHGGYVVVAEVAD